MKVFAVHQYLDKSKMQVQCLIDIRSMTRCLLLFDQTCHLSSAFFSHVFDFERGNTLWWIDTTASQLRHILTRKKATLHHVNIQIYKSQGTALMRIIEAYIIVPRQFLK